MSKSLGNKAVMASNIKRHLDERGMNVSEFARAMNYKYTTVVEWVKGNNYPRIDKIEEMANYFGVDKSDLVEEYHNNVIDRNREKLLKNYDTLSENSKIKLVDFSDELIEEEKTAIDIKFIEAARQAVAFDGKEFTEEEIQKIAGFLAENFEEKKHDK